MRPIRAILPLLLIAVSCITVTAQDFNPSILETPTYSYNIWSSKPYNHNVAPTMEDVDNAMMSVVKVRARLEGVIQWYGSASFFAREGNWLFALTNSHVAEKVDSGYTIEVLILKKGGYEELGWYETKVVRSVMGDNLDAAILQIASGKTLAHIKPIPFSNQPVFEGQKIALVNCGSARKTQYQKGTILRVEEKVFYTLPRSIGGCSGSPILSQDCKTQIGLIAWVMFDFNEGRQVGIAQKVSTFKSGLKQNKTNCSDQLFKRLRPRLRPQFPSPPISPPIEETPPTDPSDDLDFDLDDLLDAPQEPEMPSEAPEAPESDDYELEAELDEEGDLAAGRPLRDLLDRILRNQDDIMGNQRDDRDKDDGLIGGLYHQIGMLKFMMTWMWRVCLIMLAIGVAGIFLCNGWLTRISLTFFRVLVRGFSAVWAVISDAVSTTPKNNQSVEEQLRELREKIQGDMSDEG